MAMASAAIPDVPSLCGFHQFTGQQFLPKVIHAFQEGRFESRPVRRLLLLNEYIALRLTGTAFGDTTSQGMGGFFDITQRAWSQLALETARISEDMLAPVFPAAGYSAPLCCDVASNLDLDTVPVYLCGNDQTCAAAGVDLDAPGSILGSFGTAMVLYTRKAERPRSVLRSQIAGIDPLTTRYFLLGLEDECGSVVQRLADSLSPGASIETMLNTALSGNSADSPQDLEERANTVPLAEEPSGHASTGSLSSHSPSALDGTLRTARSSQTPDSSAAGLTDAQRAQAAREVLESLAGRFKNRLDEVRGSDAGSGRLIATGGLSKSREWLDLLSRTASIEIIQAPSEHAGLLGIARIIASSRSRANGQ